MNRKQVVPTLFFGLIGMILFMSAGCDRYDPVITEAPVYEDSVKVYTTSERPAYVLVKYTIPLDGCRNYHDTELLWEGGNTYYLTVQASEPHPDAPGDCPTLVWDETVYFALGSFLPGRYSVHVNGIVKQFEITSEHECLTIE